MFSNPDTGNLQLVLSEPGLNYHCLDYREREGVVEGRLLTSTCETDNNIYVNISSTGPCILPLTAGENTGTSSASFRQSIGFILIFLSTHHIYLSWAEKLHLLLHLLIRGNQKYCKYYALFLLCLYGSKYPWLKRSKKICFVVKCIWSEVKYFKFEI